MNPAEAAQYEVPSGQSPSEPRVFGDSAQAQVSFGRVALATVFFLILAVGGISEMFYWTTRSEIRRKQGIPVNDLLTKTQQSEDTLLNEYRWIKKSEGRLRIPVARARALVILEYARPTVQGATSHIVAGSDSQGIPK